MGLEDMVSCIIHDYFYSLSEFEFEDQIFECKSSEMTIIE